MRKAFTLSLPLCALLFVAPAHAVDWHVSPTGTATCGCTTRATPCSLESAANAAVAGDTVYLASGSYLQPLIVENSGTEAAPLTFKAEDCATPIIERSTSTDADQSAGVGSAKGEYLVFEGLVVRGWSIGFGNSWAGGKDSTEVSNGHWTINHCIAYSNGRTGFTFFSAPSFRLTNSISAHNGSSVLHAWSSGVTLYEATGTNLVQGVVSFENTDEQKHTDGSGFVVDEGSNGATFINNLAFGNSGSCFRLTRSSGATFIHNTCYHNSQFGSQATGPTDPGEVYFTDDLTQQGVNFANNVIVGTGIAPAGSQPILDQPTAGWSNNVVSTGAAPFFADPDGANPDLTLAASATTLIGQAVTATLAPTTDLGFDPKCLVKRAPTMFGSVVALSRWQYDIDLEYIASHGGVAKCFNAGTRSAPADIGAYKSGPVATVTAACVPSADGGAGGTGPCSGVGGGGVSGGSGAGGGAGNGGVAQPTGTAGGAGSAGAVPVPAQMSAASDDQGCGCRVAPSRISDCSSALALLSLVAGALRRRRHDLRHCQTSPAVRDQFR